MDLPCGDQRDGNPDARRAGQVPYVAACRRHQANYRAVQVVLGVIDEATASPSGEGGVGHIPFKARQRDGPLAIRGV